ncbi:MAG: hypothetical protein II322_02730, partial [Alistipes sp.]|nr:hypothetical protein [Alistipes sp.]
GYEHRRRNLEVLQQILEVKKRVLRDSFFWPLAISHWPLAFFRELKTENGKRRVTDRPKDRLYAV